METLSQILQVFQSTLLQEERQVLQIQRLF